MLIIVSNRLPISIKSIDPIEFQKSPGGLVSAIETFIKKASLSSWLWIGWPGTSLPKREMQRINAHLFQEHNYVPVYVPEKLMEKFYNGFCNRTLWPLFHSMPALTTYEKTAWESYLEVNKIFLEAILENTQTDKEIYIWIHDYHLMLLPGMIRNVLPEAKVGFFLHIPFPPPEVFAQLPWSRELLEGLLGADLIGFHTYEYTINFLRSLSRVLGIDHTLGEFEHVGVYQAYKLVKNKYPCQLVLVGSYASDDPEGEEVYREVLNITSDDKDVFVLNLPPNSHIEVNAFQRSAYVVFQKSIREGFGLVVSEAMWKGKPVIGSNVGGIKRQILDGINGFLVDSSEGAAHRARQLLANKDLRDRMGFYAKETVKHRFLIIRHLKDYIALMHRMIN